MYDPEARFEGAEGGLHRELWRGRGKETIEISSRTHYLLFGVGGAAGTRGLRMKSQERERRATLAGPHISGSRKLALSICIAKKGGGAANNP